MLVRKISTGQLLTNQLLTHWGRERNYTQEDSMSENKIQSVAKPGPASHLINGDVITINLVATKPDGTRMAAGGVFNAMGEAVNATDGKPIPGSASLDISMLSGSAKPSFNMKKYQELINQGSTEAAEDLQAAYEIELEEWSEQGNQSLEDCIAAAALDWAGRVHNVGTTDTGDGPYVKPEQIVVKGVNRATAEEAGVFIVQITPSWG